MTIAERIKQIITDGFDMDNDTIERLVFIAYYAGKTNGVRIISDQYREHIRQQKERAANCRYHNMAAEVVGPESFIYHDDYAGEFPREMGKMETKL